MLAFTSLLARLSRRQTGQATVELVAAVPFVLLAAAVAWQLALAGQTAWLCANAAQAGALAMAGGADVASAARDAVPGWSKAGMRVRVAGREVRVTMRPPSPLRALGRRLEVAAAARVGRR